MIFPDMKGLPLHRVMVRTVTEFVDDEMSTYASALAYQMLFSLFPFILFLIALIVSCTCRTFSPGCACNRNWSCHRRRWSRSTR